MDTNKENELMKSLEQSVAKSTAKYRADGLPLAPGLPSMAVNPPTATGGNASTQAEQPQTDSELALSRVTPEMVNRIEMYGAEAVFDASENQ